MKTLNKILILTLSAMTFGGGDDFLDKSALVQHTNELFFFTEDDSVTAVLAILHLTMQQQVVVIMMFRLQDVGRIWLFMLITVV